MTKKQKPLPPFTFSSSMNNLMRPLMKDKKRMGLLKVAPRVQGKIIENLNGGRILIVEKTGRDIWRGRLKSVSEALDAGVAGIGVDKTLLQRSQLHDVKGVLIVIEELRRVYFAPVADFFDENLFKSRPNYQGRATRFLPYEHFQQKYLGPRLKARRKRVSA